MGDGGQYEVVDAHRGRPDLSQKKKDALDLNFLRGAGVVVDD